MRDANCSFLSPRRLLLMIIPSFSSLFSFARTRQRRFCRLNRRAMMMMLPLNSLLFGGYKNAADEKKTKTKKKINHDDTKNNPKTPLLLSSSFCQRKQQQRRQKGRLLRSSSRGDEREKCCNGCFLCVCELRTRDFFLSIFCRLSTRTQIRRIEDSHRHEALRPV